MIRTTLGCIAVIALVVGPAQGQAPCDPLAPPAGPVVEVWPAQASTLRAEAAAAVTGSTIVLHDGFYDLGCGDAGCRLVFATDGVTLRSFSGDRNGVILDAAYQTNELISIAASDVVIADLTVRRAYDHPIHITGPGSPISGVRIHNVRIVDPGQQALKINPDASGLGILDDGTIECCSMELTDDGRDHIRDGCYTGGIDGHATSDLVIRRNRIEGFWCSDGLSEHGIHLWRAASGTLVEENLVLDCARGIGFGLGYGADNGHVGGLIRNNFVAATDTGLQGSPDGFDTGIGLESAEGAEVYHNTVVSTFLPMSSSIEWRWDLTTATVANNLVSHTLLPRNGANAILAGNIDGAQPAWFADPPAGDLHLASGTLPPVGAGAILDPGKADVDFDGLDRDDAPDVGADEYGQALFADGFESGDLSNWSAVGP